MNKKVGNTAKHDTFLFKAARIGRGDFEDRVPELSLLRDKKIGVVGLGNLGAPSALEFAKAGLGELRLLDYDTIEAGTIVRWPLGFEAIGRLKSKHLADYIRRNHLYVDCKDFAHRIGSTEDASVNGEVALINELFDGVDLIYDATAEQGVQHFLADLCQELNIPYVSVSASLGIWGGRIYRVIPSQSNGCWVCLQMFREENPTFIPNEDPKGKVHPKGCAAPTFTGTNFDSIQISAAGVRLAVATLCRGIKGGYPDFDWDIAVVNFRDSEGKAIAPAWTTHPLTQHQDCPHCNPK